MSSKRNETNETEKRTETGRDEQDGLEENENETKRAELNTKRNEIQTMNQTNSKRAEQEASPGW